MTENFLKYETSFVSSTSDFCWDRARNKSFVECIENFMTNRYAFKNGLSIFLLDTAMKSVYRNAL